MGDDMFADHQGDTFDEKKKDDLLDDDSDSIDSIDEMGGSEEDTDEEFESQTMAFMNPYEEKEYGF